VSILPIHPFAYASTLDRRPAAQLNKPVGQIEAPQVSSLQDESAALAKQRSDYTAARSQLDRNAGIASGLKSLLGTLAAQAAAGDSAAFEKTRSAINARLGKLNVVQGLAGLRPDGVADLKRDGFGVKSGSEYNLSTAAGQAKASLDIQNAQALVDRVAATTTQNRRVAGAIGQAIGSLIAAPLAIALSGSVLLGAQESPDNRPTLSSLLSLSATLHQARHQRTARAAGPIRGNGVSFFA
jgi:hypothetical protein